MIGLPGFVSKRDDLPVASPVYSACIRYLPGLEFDFRKAGFFGFLLLVLAPLSGCEPAPDGQSMDWDVTAEGLECSAPDLVTDDGGCVWYCRDFEHQKNADLRVAYDHRGLRMQIVPSQNCPSS